MRAGHLLIKIKDAKISPEDLNSATEDEEVFCAAKIEDVGKLYTETRPLKEPISWQEELTFNCTPAGDDPPCSLQLMLYKQRINSDEHNLIGMGSISLETLEEGANKRDIEVPLVNNIGKNNGIITATCQFFPSRCPGKSRDHLGRETMDPILVGKGAKEGAKELNERSPKKAPRKKKVNKPAAPLTSSQEELSSDSNGVSRGIPPEELLPVG